MQDLWRPDLAASHRGMDPGEVGVEASIEAHLELDAGSGNGLQGFVDAHEAVIDGLLAKDVLSGAGGVDNESGVCIGGRADENRVDGGD